MWFYLFQDFPRYILLLLLSKWYELFNVNRISHASAISGNTDYRADQRQQ